MTFQQEIAPTIVGRGAMNINLYIPDPDIAEEKQSGKISVQIKYSNGDIKERQFNLLNRLQDDIEGQDHLLALVALRDYLIVRIQNEVLNQ